MTLGLIVAYVVSQVMNWVVLAWFFWQLRRFKPELHNDVLRLEGRVEVLERSAEATTQQLGAIAQAEQEQTILMEDIQARVKQQGFWLKKVDRFMDAIARERNKLPKLDEPEDAKPASDR